MEINSNTFNNTNNNNSIKLKESLPEKQINNNSTIIIFSCSNSKIDKKEVMKNFK